LPESEITKYWGFWALWRATGRRVDFLSAQQLPARLWNVVLLLDDLYGRLELQDLKKKQKSKGDVDGLGNES